MAVILGMSAGFFNSNSEKSDATERVHAASIHRTSALDKCLE